MGARKQCNGRADLAAAAAASATALNRPPPCRGRGRLPRSPPFHIPVSAWLGATSPSCCLCLLDSARCDGALAGRAGGARDGRAGAGGGASAAQRWRVGARRSGEAILASAWPAQLAAAAGVPAGAPRRRPRLPADAPPHPAPCPHPPLRAEQHQALAALPGGVLGQVEGPLHYLDLGGVQAPSLAAFGELHAFI